jgi:predicted ArsR family transcriptional regulator
MGSKEIDSLRRAESQRDVLYCIIENGGPISSQEIAEKLKISVNAANIALFNLNKKDLVERVSRGVYKYKLGPVLITLLQKYLEE